MSSPAEKISMEHHDVFETRVVRHIQGLFDRLPKRFKPRDGEWNTLSAIAVAYSDGEMQVLSLATGVKCLPVKAVQNAEGIILHDWHAETVVIRAFNRFLIDECHKLATQRESTSMVVERQEPSSVTQPFAIRNNINIIMYCSEAPCGDASMELVMEAQKDSTPWQSTLPIDNHFGLLGRGSFDQLGRVRRKPARADCPITLSKSCSDKIALKQCTSVLSSITSLLISPINAYIGSLIMPKSQYRKNACERAFGISGRMQPLNGRAWPGGYSFHCFNVQTTDFEFAHSRRSGARIVKKGSNVTAVWIAQSSMLDPAGPSKSLSVRGPLLESFSEVLVNGRLQGWKEADPRGASRICRRMMWQAVVEVYSALCVPMPVSSSYGNLKASDAFAERRVVKAEAIAEALKAWVPNQLDDFTLYTM